MFEKFKKYPIKNMYVVKVGNLIKGDFYDKFIFRFFTIAKFKKHSSDFDSYYKDLLSDSSYYLASNNYNVKDYQQCCNTPIPILNYLKEFSDLEEIKEIESKTLQTGYMTRADIVKLYSVINKEEKVSNPEANKSDMPKEKEVPKMTAQNAPFPSQQATGKIMNDKVYVTEPIIGREAELKQLILTLASQKKSPILVGPSGVGKTALVEELVYKIQKNSVPDFLKNKPIVEMKVSSIVAGTRYRGDFEEKLIQTLEQVKKQNALLFIDEIHTIYGAGSSSKCDLDIAEILKQEIDRENLRVIGTTTEEEYQEYFSQDALKRRFQVIEVKEPTEKLLSQIVYKVFRDYEAQTNISLASLQDDLASIISLLIAATKKECRNYLDKTHNPDLIINMIDMAFANARIENKSELTLEDILYSVQNCSRIYESVAERTIASLKNLKPVTKTLNKKIVSFKN